MISRKTDTSHPCSSCAHNQDGRWCSEYRDDISGGDADIFTARRSCKGDHWELRENIQAIADALKPAVTYHEDRIETPTATVYKDPPSKLYE